MKEIRLAEKDDAVFIALLGRITFTEAFGHLFHDRVGLKTYLNTIFAVKKIKRSLEKENNVYWIAFVDGLPVGYAKLKSNSPSAFSKSKSVAQLQKIYVLKDFLAMKIGKLLQESLIKKAIVDGNEEIWLSVYKDNKRAIAFYKKSNFKAIGTHQYSIGDETFDFIAMSKMLNDSKTQYP